MFHNYSFLANKKQFFIQLYPIFPLSQVEAAEGGAAERGVAGDGTDGPQPVA